ncbi:hypothetical protein ACLOJK_029154 [Asimina triloba]
MGGGKYPIRAHGIRFMRSNGDPNKLYEIYLNHPKDSGFWGDVILSAGALGSPQILMLSGIGPKNHLTHFNITTLIDAKEVGQSVKDNPGFGIPLNYSSQSLHRLHVDPPKIAAIVSGFRIIIETLVAHSGFNTSDLTVLMAGKLAYPVSSGSLRLQSADPRQNPLVEFNYLSKEQDLDECVLALSLIQGQQQQIIQIHIFSSLPSKPRQRPSKWALTLVTGERRRRVMAATDSDGEAVGFNPGA